MNAEQTAAWAARYRQFAAQECPQQPLYVAICAAIAADPELLALHAEIPSTQARPNLLLAALHDELLAAPQQPLADYYPNLGGRRAPDAELPRLLRERLLGNARVASLLRSRATQTNEPGRCAVLRLAIDALVAQTGKRRIALFDFGSSAGLNLGVDEDGVDCGGSWRGPDRRLSLHCDWRGAAPPPAQPWHIVERLGVDLDPVDVGHPEARRWLQACVWPDDVARFARLTRALEWATRSPPPLERQSDGLQRLQRWLDELPPDCMPLLFNSWVLSYMDAAARADFHARVLAGVRAGRLAWICAEEASCQPPGLAAPRPGATLWSLHWQTHSRAWAWSHAHGHWAEPV